MTKEGLQGSECIPTISMQARATFTVDISISRSFY